MKNKLDKSLGAYQKDNLYNFDNEVLMNWYADRIIKQTSRENAVLELGLGHGFTTNKFAEFYAEHVVLDGSKAVIENFKQHYPECKSAIIETYFENYTTKQKFDIIVMGFVLEHVENPVLLIEKYKNFLNESGSIYIAVPNAEALNRQLGFYAGMLDNLEKMSGNDVLLGHKRYYTVKTLEKDILTAGCKIDLIEGIYLKPFTTKQMNSLALDKNIYDALCAVGINYPELCLGILVKAK